MFVCVFQLHCLLYFIPLVPFSTRIHYQVFEITLWDNSNWIFTIEPRQILHNQVCVRPKTRIILITTRFIYLMFFHFFVLILVICRRLGLNRFRSGRRSARSDAPPLELDDEGVPGHARTTDRHVRAGLNQHVVR